MIRTARRSMLLLAIFSMTMLLQAAGASTASAATTCKQYDAFEGASGLLHNVKICVAPGTDYPNYSGWGRVVDKYYAGASNCGWSLLPYDIDDIRPMYACLAVMPPQIDTWRWTGSTWVKGGGLNIGEQAYFAPYASGWRWAWTQRTGWVAVADSHAAFRWSA